MLYNPGLIYLYSSLVNTLFRPGQSRRSRCCTLPLFATISFHTASVFAPFSSSNFSKYLFLCKCDPDFVFCVKAFALKGSILGLVFPQIILERLAFGAIAKKMRVPYFEHESSSGQAPFSTASFLVVFIASSLMCLNIFILDPVAYIPSKERFFFCKYA